MNKKWSLKEGKFSIIGEFASWKIINNQVEICKKKVIPCIQNVNSLHYSTILEIKLIEKK